MTFDFQPFTELDWMMGYGGAEPFEDGGPLLSIGDVLIDDEPVTIAIDSRGVSLDWSVDDETYEVRVLGAEGARLLALLRPRMTYRDVAALPGVSVEQV